MCLYAFLILQVKEYYIHIGVGSDVVCLTVMGNARALDGGTDNSGMFHVFFMYKRQRSGSHKEGSNHRHSGPEEGMIDRKDDKVVWLLVYKMRALVPLCRGERVQRYG